MKKSILLLVLFTMIVSCKSLQKKEKEATINIENKNIVFEYESSTRGNFKKVIVKEDAVLTTFERDGSKFTTQKMSKETWNRLMTLLNNVNLEQMKDLKAPTNNRASDRAASGKLTVVTQENTFVSDFFDHGNPPAKIAEITKMIVDLAQFENEILE